MGIMNVMIILFAFIFSTGALLYYIVQNCVMMLEYTILPRGMAPALDPKDLKAFIKQPPPPIGQPVSRDNPKGDGGGGSAPVNKATRPGRGGGEAADEPSEEDGDDGDDGAGSSAVLKPRPRKRRKR
jgi:hypothetical protein